MSRSYVGAGGNNFAIGSMKNRPDAKPGTPIPFGERPADRPFANQLGRRFAADNVILGTSNVQVLQAQDPTYFRSQRSAFGGTLGPKTFSWETQS